MEMEVKVKMLAKLKNTSRHIGVLSFFILICIGNGCATVQPPRPPSGKGWGTTAQGTSKMHISASTDISNTSQTKTEYDGKVTTTITVIKLNTRNPTDSIDSALQVLRVGQNVSRYNFKTSDYGEVTK